MNSDCAFAFTGLCMHRQQYGASITAEICGSCQLYKTKQEQPPAEHDSAAYPGTVSLCQHLGSARKCCGYTICRMHKRDTITALLVWQSHLKNAPEPVLFTNSILCCETCPDHEPTTS